MIHWLQGLRQEHAALWFCSVYTAILIVPTIALLGVDSRLVTGANPWLKPLKFEVSIVVFNLTVAWLLSTLALPAPSPQSISRIVAAAMFLETSAIVLQAARGVPSHCNTSTPLDAAVFTTMAIAITVNTLAIGWLAILSFQPQEHLPDAMAWGIRLGIVLFLLSSLHGFQMVGNQGHTVGAEDGGPGLPFLRWSTAAGDLRVAHFIGIHSIQILPLLGYLVSRNDRQSGTFAVAAAFCLIAGLFIAALNQAWAGRPLLLR